MKVFCSLFDYEAAVKLRLSGRTATLIAFVEVKANTGNTKSTKTVLKNYDHYHVKSAIKLGNYNVGRQV